MSPAILSPTRGGASLELTSGREWRASYEGHRHPNWRMRRPPSEQTGPRSGAYYTGPDILLAALSYCGMEVSIGNIPSDRLAIVSLTQLSSQDPLIVFGMALSSAPFIEPCLPTVSRSVPTGPQWAYEIKHDGFRFLAVQAWL